MTLSNRLEAGRLGARLAALLALSAASCDPSSEPRPARLRIGIVAYEAAEQVVASYRPLVAYLTEEVGMPFELVVAGNYPDLVSDFAGGRTDLARFGAYTFTRASEQVEIVPLVMREVDRHETTLFLARTADPRQSLEDFRGGRFTFGDRVSLSGHLMPRRFLEGLGLEPESYFAEVEYTGGHDQVAFLVRDGVMDLGAANSTVIGSMFDQGRLRIDELRIVAQTPPYPAFLWAASGRLPDDIRRRVRDAFLALTPQHPSHRAAAEVLGGGGYLPVSMSDYAEMLRVVRDAEARGLIDR